MKTQDKSLSGQIIDLWFGGYGGRNSGEMIIKVLESNKLLASDLVYLHLGWAGGLNDAGVDRLIEMWTTLLKTYAKEQTVTFTYRDIGASYPEIVAVD